RSRASRPGGVAREGIRDGGRAPMSDAVPASTRGEPPGPIRVLVVDDEPTLRRTIARALSAKGFDVVQCEDGASALAQIRASAFDVMLLDLMLPGVSGLDVLREVKSIRPDIECVMMT